MADYLYYYFPAKGLENKPSFNKTNLEWLLLSDDSVRRADEEDDRLGYTAIFPHINPWVDCRHRLRFSIISLRTFYSIYYIHIRIFFFSYFPLSPFTLVCIYFIFAPRHYRFCFFFQFILYCSQHTGRTRKCTHKKTKKKNKEKIYIFRSFPKHDISVALYTYKTYVYNILLYIIR